MTTDDQTAQPQDLAVAAFTRLEGEVALIRRAVENLATEKANVDIPDYSATLGEMAQHIDAATKALRTIAAKPAMEMTPESMAQRINQAARQERQADRELIGASQNRYDSAVRDLRGIVASAKVAADQRERLIWVAGGGILVGCLLWAIVPGPIARALPESWYLPEKIATRVLGKASIWDAGMRLLQAGSPEAWQAISDAVEMRRRNREEISRCERSAAKSQKAVTCSLKVAPDRQNRE